MSSAARTARLRRANLDLVASGDGQTAPRETVGPLERFFDKLPALLRAEAVASALGISIKTIYDWKYRRNKREVPVNLFVKFNGQLFINTEALKRWMIAQNPRLL